MPRGYRAIAARHSQSVAMRQITTDTGSVGIGRPEAPPRWSQHNSERMAHSPKVLRSLFLWPHSFDSPQRTSECQRNGARGIKTKQRFDRRSCVTTFFTVCNVEVRAAVPSVSKSLICGDPNDPASVVICLMATAPTAHCQNLAAPIATLKASPRMPPRFETIFASDSV